MRRAVVAAHDIEDLAAVLAQAPVLTAGVLGSVVGSVRARLPGD